MEANEYQKQIRKYADYPQELGPFTVIMSLQSDLGRLAEKLNKSLVEDHGSFTNEDKIKVLISLGDILFNVSNIATDLGYTLTDVMSLNITKYAKSVENTDKKNQIQN